MWTDIEVSRGDGRPTFLFSGETAAHLDPLGLTFHVSLSHDAGVATASVIAEER